MGEHIIKRATMKWTSVSDNYNIMSSVSNIERDSWPIKQKGHGKIKSDS